MVSLTVYDGTRASRSQEDEKTSEQSVGEACRESVECSEGLVIADFSPRNFERLESFQEIARKTGKKLVAMAKDVYMLHNLQCIGGSCTTDMKHLLDIKPEGGTYIYSACEAFNEEMEIDFIRLWHWLLRFNIAPCGFSLNENGSLSFEKRYHTEAGHWLGRASRMWCWWMRGGGMNCRPVTSSRR